MRWARQPRDHDRKVPEFLNVPWGIVHVILFLVIWTVVQLVCVVLLVLAAHFIPEARHILDALADGKNTVAQFAGYLFYVSTGLGVLYVFMRHTKASWKDLGWRKSGLLRSLIYLLLTLIVFMVAATFLIWVVSVLVPGFNADQEQKNDFIDSAGTHFNIAIAALVLLPPVLEETIFRGFIFPAIAKRSGLIWGAVISSAIFGIFHFQANVSIYTFVLGLLLCFMYVRLRSIIPGMVLHMLNNFLAFIVMTQK